MLNPPAGAAGWAYAGEAMTANAIPIKQKRKTFATVFVSFK
jgi:hypothetical protein